MDHSVIQKVNEKKKISVLMGRAKNEAIHILEWISYHKVIGFDEIVIFSNPSQDGTDEILQRLAKASIIHHEICYLANGETADREMNSRLISYTKNLNYDWGALFDIDEFLLLKKHNTVNDLLSDFGHADGIALNWRNFGSSGMVEPGQGLTIERFTHCAALDSPMNRWVKSFGRLKEVTGGGPHYFHLKNGNAKYFHVSGNKFLGYANQESINHEVASLNHYAIRSKKEFTLKRLRGDAMQSIEKQAEVNRYNHHYFRSRDLNECVDLSIINFAEKTRQQMQRYAEASDIIELIRTSKEQQLAVMENLPLV